MPLARRTHPAGPLRHSGAPQQYARRGRPRRLEFTLPDGSRRTAVVSKGIIKIESNEVLLLVDAVEASETQETLQ